MAFFSDAAMKDFVHAYTTGLRADNPKNTTRKNYQDLTSEDFKNFGDEDLLNIRLHIQDEQYSYIDQILPSGMSRADYTRNILRECARRGTVQKGYTDIFPSIPNFNTQRITVTRTAFGSKDAVAGPVTEVASIIAIRDASIDMAVNNAYAFQLKDDVAVALGRKNDRERMVNTDAAAFDFGYTVGAMPQFKQNNRLNIRLETGQSAEQIQAQFCPVMDKLFQEGRAYDNRDAIILGFMQGRVDGRTNYQPVNEHIGIIAECPQTPRLANDNTTQRGKVARQP